jgi:hypothetical protein
MLLNKINKYSITAMYIFAIIGLIGADGIGLFLLLVPNSPIGNFFYVTILPFLIGCPGFILSLFVYEMTGGKL